ncbi:MAG: hypothetical protein AB1483_12290 [Candidatus Zixiibacteriota bacterium]
MNNIERAEQLVLARNFAEALKILQPIDLSQLSEKVPVNGRTRQWFCR